jgi:hypothetical protein
MYYQKGGPRKETERAFGEKNGKEITEKWSKV